MYFLMERTWNSCDNFLLKDRSSDVFFERRLNAAAFGLRNLFIFHVEKSKYLSISAEVPGSYIEKFAGKGNSLGPKIFGPRKFAGTKINFGPRKFVSIIGSR